MDDLSISDYLFPYYARLFPFDDLYRWLSYGNGDIFKKREFSFTLQDNTRDCTFVRYQSYNTYKHFRAEILHSLPLKIDLGAIYSYCPRERKNKKRFRPVQRELVFDIDMSDYDDVRTCCKGGTVCSKCWKFLAVACNILDIALRSDFAYKHILWVFSGRRGIHCWVCDSEARALTPIQRNGVGNYFEVSTGGQFKKKKVALPGKKIHYSITRALRIIEPVFIPMCIVEQNVLGTKEGIEVLLEMLPNDEKHNVRTLFDECDSSKTRWDAFVNYVERKKAEIDDRYQHLIAEVMLQYVYPRLDINVSKGMAHLLKSPFCLHPETGKICVPFRAEEVYDFNPDESPTVNTVINEINEYGKNDATTENLHRTKVMDYEKTSLLAPMRIFHEFLVNLEES